MSRQTWPPQEEAPPTPDPTWQRVFWCRPSAMTMMGMVGLFGTAWLILWLVSPGMAYRWLVLGVLAVPPLIFATIAVVALWRCWHEAVLARVGAAATGEVARIVEGRGGSVLVHVYRIEYRFRDASGREVTGRLRTRNPRQWLFYCGAPLAVRYDPARPERNTLRNI